MGVENANWTPRESLIAILAILEDAKPFWQSSTFSRDQLPFSWTLCHAEENALWRRHLKNGLAEHIIGGFQWRISQKQFSNIVNILWQYWPSMNKAVKNVPRVEEIEWCSAWHKQDGLEFQLSLYREVLDSQMLLPIVCEGLVEGNILVLGDLLWSSHPDRLLLVHQVPLVADLLDFLLLLVLFFLDLQAHVVPQLAGTQQHCRQFLSWVQFSKLSLVDNIVSLHYCTRRDTYGGHAVLSDNSGLHIRTVTCWLCFEGTLHG